MKQNHKKTLFRKFLDWNYFHNDGINRAICILGIVMCVATCLFIHTNYAHEVHTYDESNYKYLEAVVHTFWDENTQTLKYANIPDNVHIEEGKFFSSSADFKCVLDTKYLVTNDPFVEVHISDNSDLEITHYTESQYVGDAKANFIVFYFLLCVLCLFAVMVVWWFVKISIYILCIVCDFVVRLVTWFKPHDTEKAK